MSLCGKGAGKAPEKTVGQSGCNLQGREGKGKGKGKENDNVSGTRGLLAYRETVKEEVEHGIGFLNFAKRQAKLRQ